MIKTICFNLFKTFAYSTLLLANLVFAEELRIGVLIDSSGPAQLWGQQANRGIEMAMEDLKQDPQFQDTEIKLFYEDTKTDPKTAILGLNRLIDQHRVQAVLAPVWSYIGSAVESIALRRQVLVLTTGSFETMLPPHNPYYYSICPRADSIGAGFDKFLKINPQYKTVAMVCPAIPWGQAYEAALLKAAETQGVKVLENLKFNFDPDYDFRSEALKIKRANPDLVFSCYNYHKLKQRLNELGLNYPALTTSEILQTLELKNISYQEIEGLSFVDWRANDQFDQRFIEKYKQNPIFEPYTSFDGLKALALAIKSNPGNPVDGLKQLKLDGQAGPLDFSKGSSGNFSKIELYKITQGEVSLQ